MSANIYTDSKTKNPITVQVSERLLFVKQLLHYSLQGMLYLKHDLNLWISIRV